MKKIRLLVLIIFIAFKGYSQPVVLTENFTNTDSLISAGTPAWAPDFTLKKSAPNAIRASVGNGSTSSLTTLSFSTVGFTNLSLSFWHICKIQIFDTARVEISTDGGINWTTLPANTYQGQSASYSSIERFASNAYNEWLANDNLAQPNNSWWKQETFNLNSIGLGYADVKIRFLLKDGVAFPGANGNYGWVIDDVKITGANGEIVPPVITYTNPIFQNFVFNNTGPFTVNTTITDASGISAAQLFYRKNGASFSQINMNNPSGNNWQGVIPAANYNDTIDYYVVAIDGAPAQNTSKAPAVGFMRFVLRQTGTSGIYEPPFVDDFETQLGWTANPAVGSISQTAWEYGKPNYQIKNTVYSGLNCWSTNRNVPYSNNSNAVLISPPFDFSNAFNIILSFYTNFKTFDDKDAMRIDYSLDNGSTWQVLGSAADSNWYNTTNVNNSGKPGFTGNSNGWKQYKLPLSFLDNYNNDRVRFRFVFTSDASNIQAGFSIDDFGLSYDLTTDLGIIQILTPTPSCTPQGEQRVRAIVKNLGALPVKDTVDIAYRLNNSPAVVEKFYLDLNSGETDTVIFTTSINIPTGSHLFRVLTVYTPDETYNNDMTEISFTTVTTKSLPYSNNFEASNALNDFCLHNGGNSIVKTNTVNPITGGKDLLFESKGDSWTTSNPSLLPGNKKFIWNNDINPNAATIARLFLNTNNLNNVLLQLKLRLKTIQDTPITNYFRIVANGKQISPTLVPQNANQTDLNLLYDLSPVLPDKTLNLEFQSKNSKDFDGWGVGNFIDDILIYGINNRDWAANKIFNSAGSWPLAGDSVSAAVELRNVGLNSIDTGIVKLVVNNVTIDSLRKIQTILPNQNSTISFNKKFALKAGFNEIKAMSIYPSDQNRLNDTVVTYIYAWPYFNVPYFNNFDSTSGFFLNQSNNQTKWEWGQPTKGYLDSAYSAPKAWVTNIDTNYFNKSRAYLYTPVFNYSGGKNPTVSFYQKRKAEPGKDGFSLQYTTDGSTWITAGFKGDPKASNWYNSDTVPALGQTGFTGQSETFEKSTIRLPQLNNASKVQYRFYFASNDSINSDGILIDDFSTFIPDARDLGVTRIFTPIISNTDPNKAYLKIQIRNFGQDTIYSTPVSYQINGGAWITETWIGTVYPFTVTNHTFTIPFTIPAGNYEVCAKTELQADQNLFNDQVCNTFYGIPVITPNYTNTFEDSSMAAWTKASTVWEFGEPAASNTVINSAFSGQYCWKTKLSGNYPNGSTDYLYTPYFNFSCSDSVIMSFMHRFDFENNKDGGVIEFSTNRGLTWKTYDTTGATNWYNNVNVAALSGKGWSGNSGGWKQVTVSLRQFEGKPDLVRFRFKFSSDAANNRNGWAIDDFKITAKEKYDIALTDYALTPVLNVVGDAIKFKIKGQSNLGTLIDTLNFGLNIDGNQTTEQMIVSPPLGCNQKFNYEFNYNFNTTSGNHNVIIYSFNPNNKSDLDPSNDTIRFSFFTRDVSSLVNLAQQNKKCYDFENGAENWISVNALTGSLTDSFGWEIGNPAKTNLTGVKSGDKAAVAGLSTNYPNGTAVAWVSPPILLDTNSCYNINFWHNYDMEQPHDGGSFEFSNNKGQTWNTFGLAFEPNWMNTPKITSNKNQSGWSGTSNGWVYASRAFKPVTTSTIHFRFILTSNASINKEGWAIDNFCIEKLSNCFVSLNNDTKKEQNHITVYPNPAITEINFNINLPANNNHLEIKIYDVLGKQITELNEPVNAGALIRTFNCNELPAGLYFYQIKINEQLTSGKFVKQ